MQFPTEPTEDLWTGLCQEVALSSSISALEAVQEVLLDAASLHEVKERVHLMLEELKNPAEE